MALQQRDRRPSDRGTEKGSSPSIYLPAADPPRKQPWLLALAAALLTAWLLFLLYLALRT